MTTTDAAPAPVFVDDTGRRHRAVKVVGWLVAVVVVGYLALLGISLVGSPGLVPLSLPALGRILPGPAAAPLEPVTRGEHRREPLLPPATPTASVPAAPYVVAAVPSANARTTTRRTTATAHPSLSPTPTPTATHTPQANPSPNGSTRPSHGPTSHPSPKNTKRTTSSPAPTATAT